MRPYCLCIEAIQRMTYSRRAICNLYYITYMYVAGAMAASEVNVPESLSSEIDSGEVRTLK